MCEDHVLRAELISKEYVSGIHRSWGFKESLVALARGRRERPQHTWALEDVTVRLRPGSRLAVIGGNGAGKSTLLRCLAGVIQPDRGTVVAHPKLRLISLLQLGTGFHPDLTGRENVYLNASVYGATQEEARARLDAIVGFAGIERKIDLLLRTYSSGMQLRLGLSIALHIEPDIMVIDEAYSVGDSEFRRRASQRLEALSRQGTAMVLATHDLTSAQEDCDEAIYLRRGRIAASGVPAEIVRQYQHDAGER